jgi:hypothetical protein
MFGRLGPRLPALAWWGLVTIVVGSIGFIWAASWREFVQEFSKSAITAALTGLVIGILVKEYERGRTRQSRIRILEPWLEEWKYNGNRLRQYTAYCFISTPEGSGDPVYAAERRIGELSSEVHSLGRCMLYAEGGEAPKEYEPIRERICSLAKMGAPSDFYQGQINHSLQELNRILPHLSRVGGESVQDPLSHLGGRLDIETYWPSVQETVSQILALRESLDCNSRVATFKQLDPRRLLDLSSKLTEWQNLLSTLSSMETAAKYGPTQGPDD